MKIQPCGMVLDFLPCCYEVQVKPFRDSDVAVGFKYYPAPPGAKTFPGWSFINSRNWWEFHDELVDLGEQSYNERTNMFVPTPAGVDGQHFCGELDWFENGQPYDPDAPPTEYNADGIALCCLVTKNKNVAGEGSPAALKFFYPPFMVGVCGEGSPRAKVTLQPPAVACGEGSPASVVATYAPMIVAGDGEGSPASLVATYAPLIGRACGEGSPASVVATYAPMIVAGDGEGSPASLVALTAVGRAGGEGGVASICLIYAPLIGRACGEAAPASTIGLMPGIVGEAGGEGSPASIVTLTPLAPGTTCLTAPTLTLGVTYNFTTNTTPGSSQWVKWTGSPALRTLTTTAVTGPNFFTQISTGSTCATLTGTQVVNASPFAFGTDPSGNVWLQVVNPPGGAQAWSVSLV